MLRLVIMTMSEDAQTWPVTIDGVSYTVSLAPTGNGKLAVRVNERVAAKPIAPDEVERVFNLAGATCTLSRERSGEFNLIVEQPLPELSQEPASRIDFSFIAPRYFVWGFVALLFAAPLFWVMAGTSYEKRAKRRVENVLTGMSEAPHSATIGLWARNARSLDSNELSWASDQFDRWRFAAGLADTIKSWTILDVTAVKDAQVPTVIVRVTIDGKALSMKVPERMPISWADAP
jgi:hypothetical protein